MSKSNKLSPSDLKSFTRSFLQCGDHLHTLCRLEINNRLAKYDIKYIALSNITHLKKLNVEMISEYNLIIMSNNLISNKRYQELIRKTPLYNFTKYLQSHIYF